MQQFETIIREYGDTVYRLSLSRCGDRELAEDVSQQTFLLLLEKKPRFADKAQLRRWLVSAARKLTAAAMRRAENKNLPLDDADRAVTDGGGIELYDLISSLPEKLREPTLLYYVEGFGVRETAELLGLTEGAVKMRLARARKALEKIYKEEIL